MSKQEINKESFIEILSRLELATKILESIVKIPQQSIEPFQSKKKSNLPSLDEFQNKLDSFQQKGLQLAIRELQDMTKITVKIFNQMKILYIQSENMKALSQEQKAQIQKEFIKGIQELEQYTKNNDIAFHAKAIIEVCKAALWIIITTPEMFIKGQIESSEFNALKFKTKKEATVNIWYEELILGLKILLIFVQNNFPTGLNWNANGQLSFQEVFNQIQIQEQNQKQNLDNKQQQLQIEQKKQPSTSQTIQKQPKKILTNNWQIENFNKEKIIIEDNEVKITHQIFIDNCKECKIVIQGKPKGITMTNCIKCQIVFQQVVISIEIINCKNLEIQSLIKLNSASIEKSNEIRLILPKSNYKECNIISSCVSGLNVTFIKENGEMEEDFAVIEQYLTKFNEKKGTFETTPYSLHLDYQ